LDTGSERNDYPVEHDEDKLVHATLDFNVGNMHCGFGHVFGEGKSKQLGYFSEMNLKGEKGDTENAGREIIERYAKEKDSEGYYTGVLVTCDASGKARKTTGLSDVKTLDKLGLRVRYSTANPRIKRSQLITNGLLARVKILINPTECPILKKDLKMVKQKEDFEIDKKNTKLTHMSDGLRYWVYHEYPDFLDRTSDKRWKTVRY